MKICKECGKEITKGSKSGYCHSCSNKRSIHQPDCQCAICKDNSGKNNSMFGKTGKECPSTTHGLTCADKHYYCKDCQKEISYQSGLYGSGLCGSCSKKGKCHKAWNKGLKGTSGKRLVEINKYTIIKHHIYLKKNSKEILKMPQGQHRSLQWKGYEYLIYLGIEKEYIEYFLREYKEAIGAQNVLHHIDCNRRNNNTDNFLYVASKGIHNKLHQEAYEYLVNVNKIKEYLEWFFLKEKKIPDEKTCKGGTIL